MNFYIKLVMSIIILTNMCFAKTEILSSSGDVQYRRGMEEEWKHAHQGILLDEIDTILTLEGWVTLKISENTTFKLGPNSILDIGDLRRITRKEMFLFLMSEKIDRVQPRENATLKLGNVTTVHGLQAADSELPSVKKDWHPEANAAKAMYEQKFYTNAVVKYSKIFKKIQDPNDCGEINFYLAKSLEALDERGRAIDQYQLAIERACDTNNDMAQEAKQRVKKLSR